GAFHAGRRCRSLPPLRKHRLHHAQDRGSAVRRRTDLEEGREDLTHRMSPPLYGWIASGEAHRAAICEPTSGRSARAPPEAYHAETPPRRKRASKPRSMSVFVTLRPTSKPQAQYT